jgi:hypothetical protein
MHPGSCESNIGFTVIPTDAPRTLSDSAYCVSSNADGPVKLPHISHWPVVWMWLMESGGQTAVLAQHCGPEDAGMYLTDYAVCA